MSTKIYKYIKLLRGKVMAKWEVTVKLKNNTTETKEIFAGCQEGAKNKTYEAYGFKPNAKVKDIVIRSVRKLDYD